MLCLDAFLCTFVECLSKVPELVVLLAVQGPSCIQPHLLNGILHVSLINLVILYSF